MHKLRDSPGQTEAGLRDEIERLSGPGPIHVLGLGYLDKADDGAGVLVAEALKKPFPDFSFSEHDGVEGIVLDISERDGEGTVLFVDAADMDSEPGTVRMVPREAIEDREISTHRVPVALMASILERSGKRVAVVCIQPGTIEFRAEVSAAVATTVDRLVAALTAAMAERIPRALSE